MPSPAEVLRTCNLALALARPVTPARGAVPYKKVQQGEWPYLHLHCSVLTQPQHLLVIKASEHALLPRLAHPCPRALTNEPFWPGSAMRSFRSPQPLPLITSLPNWNSLHLKGLPTPSGLFSLANCWIRSTHIILKFKDSTVRPVGNIGEPRAVSSPVVS